jgi:hypothetical protein
MSDDPTICEYCQTSNKRGARDCWVCSAPFASATSAPLRPPSESTVNFVLGCFLVAAMLVGLFVVTCFGIGR